MPLFRRKPQLTEADVSRAVNTALDAQRAEFSNQLNLLTQTPPPKRSWPFSFDHPMLYSLPMSPVRLPGKSWSTRQLRAWARYWDPLRSVVEYLKSEAASVPIAFSAAEGCEQSPSVEQQIAFMKAFCGDRGPLGGTATRRIFESKIFEDALVLGNYVVWYELSRSGNVLGVEHVDGATVMPRVDAKGWQVADFPHEQWVMGVPVARFGPGEIRYDGLMPQTDTPFFASPVEYAFSRIEAGMCLDNWNTSWLTNGNVVTSTVISLGGTGTEMTMDEMEQFIAYWEQNANSPGGRQRTKFTPPGSQVLADHSRKDQDFIEFELQVIRRLCSVFGVQPASIGYVGEQYKVTQDGSMDASQRVGLGRLLELRTEFYNDLCWRLGCPDVQAVNKQDDPKRKGLEIENRTKQCGGAYRTINEVRSEEGLPPIDGGDELRKNVFAAAPDGGENPDEQPGKDATE